MEQRSTRKAQRAVSNQTLLLCLFAFAIIVSIITPGTSPAERDGSQAAVKGPRPGLKPLTGHGEMQIGEEDRCPVCAMRPIRYPKSSCALQLKDGRTFYFCATGCMIRAWMHPEVYLGVEKTQLRLPLVREYFTGRQMDGRQLEWVAGSDIVGPMGPALVPVDGEKECETFRRRHGGKAVFRLDQLDDARWRELTGKDP
jgi:nitrous oxide reductase accessory protein NosL